MPSVTKTERAEALERLRELLKPGTTVYTTLLHVSRSGMQREIGLWTIVTPSGGGEPYNQYLSGYAAKALGMQRGKRDGIVIGGCGMDMGFALVYELSAALWPEGVPCAGETCQSNDHNNNPRYCATCGHSVGMHNFMRNDGRATLVGRCTEDGCVCAEYVRGNDPRGPSVTHRDGGYALRQRWL